MKEVFLLNLKELELSQVKNCLISSNLICCLSHVLINQLFCNLIELKALQVYTFQSVENL